jgi:O-antigen/teichoic acid export membrane protein
LENQPNRSLHAGAKWVQGAAILGLAAVISKLLGTIQKIPLQNIAGDGAYGIYTAVYPFYILILFLATAGFPIAVSAFVAERATQDDVRNARRVLTSAIFLLSISGVLGFLLLFFGAGGIALLIGNTETKPAIQSVSFALIFVPIMSALRGYFQGWNDMLPTAVSQVAEQFVRVGTMVAVLLMLSSWSWSDSWVAAGATFGAVTGACVGMLIMLMYWQRHIRHEARSPIPVHDTTDTYPYPYPLEPYSLLMKRMLRFALPVCIGAIAVPVISIVDTFTLPRLFRAADMSDHEVMQVFGIYARGLPLVQMVAMLVSSISVAIVPAISEARVSGQWSVIRTRSESSIRFTWLVGLAASVGLAVTAYPVNIMLYANDLGTSAIAILAFTAMFSTLNITTAAVLQGMGAVTLPAYHLLLAALIKIVLNICLTPIWGMNGAALAGVIAFGCAAVLNLVAIRRRTGVVLPSRTYIVKPMVALGVMAGVAWGISYGLPPCLDELIGSRRMIYTITACTAILAGMIAFLIALFGLKIITAEDVTAVPGAQRRIIPFLIKLRIIRE